MRFHYFLIFIIFLLNIDSIKTICVPGENCPLGKGVCSKSECVCYYGFKTLYTDVGNQIYCNYRQINRLIPLIIEFFFPSIGLLYMGRTIHGLIKLFCIIVLTLYKAKILDANIITALIAITFLFLYAIDLICLIFAVYTDGKGMPLL